VLQFDDVLGADVRVGESGKLEQSGNVPLIFGADVTHALTVGKVVFAVGHFQAALQQVGGPTLWVVEAGCHPQPEKVGSMKVVDVQGIDIRPQALTQNPGQVVLVANDSNGVEVWAERSEAFGFDGDSVHVGVVDVGNFAGIGTSSRIGLGCCFDQASDTLADQVVRAIEVEAVWSNVPAIRRNFGALEPAAVGVVVEIVTGFDRASMFAITMPWVSGESAVCAWAMIGASAKRAYAAAFQDNNLSVNLMGNTPGSAAFLSVGEVMGIATRLASYGSRRASSSPST
jgi:hypothetical protein